MSVKSMLLSFFMSNEGCKGPKVIGFIYKKQLCQVTGCFSHKITILIPNHIMTFPPE